MGGRTSHDARGEGCRGERWRDEGPWWVGRTRNSHTVLDSRRVRPPEGGHRIRDKAGTSR